MYMYIYIIVKKLTKRKTFIIIILSYTQVLNVNNKKSSNRTECASSLS